MLDSIKDFLGFEKPDPGANDLPFDKLCYDTSFGPYDLDLIKLEDNSDCIVNLEDDSSSDDNITVYII